MHQLRGETEEALNMLVQSPALFLAVGFSASFQGFCGTNRALGAVFEAF